MTACCGCRVHTVYSLGHVANATCSWMSTLQLVDAYMPCRWPVLTYLATMAARRVSCGTWPPEHSIRATRTEGPAPCVQGLAVALPCVEAAAIGTRVWKLHGPMLQHALVPLPLLPALITATWPGEQLPGPKLQLLLLLQLLNQWQSRKGGCGDVPVGSMTGAHPVLRALLWMREHANPLVSIELLLPDHGLKCWRC
jgi:hypothetical protein